MRMFVTAVLILSTLCLVCGETSDFEKQLRVLSKQVTVLLEKRKEDMKIIEDNMRKTIYDISDFKDIRDDVKLLRLKVDQLSSGKIPSSQLENNDKLTIKWIFSAMEELKTEVTELQSTLNATVILQNHERVETDLSLMKNDIINLNSELESTRKQNAKYEAELQMFRQEIDSMKENWRSTAVMCGTTKNQLKVAQFEWNQNWKIINEKSPLLGAEIGSHSSRHQRILKQHVINLEKKTKSLNKENYFLKTKFLKMEDEVKTLQNELRMTRNPKEIFDKTYDNEIENYIKTGTVKPDKEMSEKLLNITEQQRINTEIIRNLTKQSSNFDKLHFSMLALLENVEAIEAKVDKTVPEFRSEISKLEVQVAQTSADVSLLKEDQKNIMDSLKAISFSVSNLQDKTSDDHKHIEKIDATIENILRSSTIQTTKLHDHIFKGESNSININATKATIHLVEELKSFETEYKSIVNKLPRDCNTIDGPSGIYLISPGEAEPILAHCEDGWTTIQKRYDGSINFNRNWNEYANGFGSATGEHWLGNKNLHHLTRDNCSQLEINIKDIYGKYWQANYGYFNVGNYSSGFKLVIGKFKGNASDALNYQNFMEFSTIDNDRDISNTNCASNYEGGWWYSHCQQANLNGRYNLGLTWFDSSRNQLIAVATSEMRVKRTDVC